MNNEKSELFERYCTMLYNIGVNENVISDLRFAKELLEINDCELCSKLGIPRSSLNNWVEERNNISKVQYERIYSFIYENGMKINKLKSQLYKDKETDEIKYLYHGAKKEIVDDISLAYSKDNNDFGKAFYLGESFEQAASFVSNIKGSNVYICEFKNSNKLKTKVLNVDEDWMLMVAYFRGRLFEYGESKRIKDLIDDIHKYDLVIAPIANNNMYQIIDSFIQGEITNLQCINSLSASNLGKQYVFLTEKAIRNLSVKERCYLCGEERKYYESIKYENSETGRQKVKYILREYAGKGKYIEEYK